MARFHQIYKELFSYILYLAQLLTQYLHFPSIRLLTQYYIKEHVIEDRKHFKQVESTRQDVGVPQLAFHLYRARNLVPEQCSVQLTIALIRLLKED